MNGKPGWSVVCLSVFAGLFGGTVANWLATPKSVLAQKAPPVSPKVLRVERLELVDKQGNVRGVLEVLPSGTPRLVLGDLPLRAAWITDEGLSIGDVRGGGQGVVIGPLPKDGGSGVRVFDTKSGVTTITSDAIGLTDKWDDLRAVISTNNGPGFTLYDRGRKPRVVLAVPASVGIGGIMVLGADNNVLWSVP
jgi:hypothetical protein